MKTIDINCRFHSDKVGNTYFGGNIVVDYGLETAKIFQVPYMCGYGDMYLYKSFEILKDNGVKINSDVIVRHSYVEVLLVKRLLEFIQAYVEVDSSYMAKNIIKENLQKMTEIEKKLEFHNWLIKIDNVWIKDYGIKEDYERMEEAYRRVVAI